MPRYGCHNLQRGNRDPDATGANALWGPPPGPPRISVCAGAPPTLAVPAGTPGGPPAGAAVPLPTYVHLLQRDLATLGFSIVGTADGDYGGGTERAVREFQIYAKMDNVARIQPTAAAAMQVGADIAAGAGVGNPGVGPNNISAYINSLEQVPNTEIYAGDVSGVLNAETRRIITHWLTENWRCPVIVEAWNIAAGTTNRTTLVQGNLYRKDDHANSAPRMFVRDFSGRYTMPAGRSATDMHVLGDWRQYPPSATDGPTSVPESDHCWTEAEILPERLMGAADTYTALRTAATATPPTRVAEFSTFRVVRATSEVECKGYFDCINGNDNAFISLGPCHWTLAIHNGGTSIDPGELPGYLAFLQDQEAAGYTSALGFFGLQSQRSWNAAGQPNGASLFNDQQVKFSSRLSLPTEGARAQVTSTDLAAHDYFRSWHWFYRFMMAGRTIAPYRQRMWHMARIRLRDILRVPWGAALPAPVGNDGTIGTVFTSEKAVAMLLRWHIRFPGDVVHHNAAGTTETTNSIRAALTHATTHGTQSYTTDPSTWTNAHEAELIAGLDAQVTARANANLRSTVTTVMNWPGNAAGRTRLRFTLRAPAFTLDPLSENRNSLDLDVSGLPAVVPL